MMTHVEQDRIVGHTIGTIVGTALGWFVAGLLVAYFSGLIGHGFPDLTIIEGYAAVIVGRIIVR